MEPLPDSAIVYQALLRKWWIDSETYEFAIPENNISQYILSHKLGMRREPDIQYCDRLYFRFTLTQAEYCQPPTSLLALKIPTRNVETRSLASLQKSTWDTVDWSINR
ncbi:MAG: hypothetical protein GDA43_07705 [Hormoscilla sp. SP5CHS1]|nr:hypothetical protein [Hormoscilla sp. SP12CHS1]MBC6453108.1 hypothetical protein [Hormoscilla sp. SP5CHS1]